MIKKITITNQEHLNLISLELTRQYITIAKKITLNKNTKPILFINSTLTIQKLIILHLYCKIYSIKMLKNFKIDKIFRKFIQIEASLSSLLEKMVSMTTGINGLKSLN